MHTTSRRLHAVLLLSAALLAACATRAPSGDAITRLQVQRDRQPGAAAVHRSLGIALYKAGRYPEARTALAEAARLDARDGTTSLYLGLTAEQQGDFAAARSAYAGYLKHGRTRRLRAQLEKRLAALHRREIEAAAKLAVANEATLGQVPGNPRVVAVMPFRFAGTDSSLQPLERGLAELVTTDLARSAQLTVVERARMQAMLDEIALQQGAGAEGEVPVRAGRLLRAGRIVQGGLLQVGGDALRVDAAVVDVPTSEAVGRAAENDQLHALLDLEKRLVLDLFDDLGVTLTAAERRAIEERPTRSMAAFLAYSRGLMDEDAGRFDAASRHFQDAYQIDPRFSIAAQRGASAASAAEAQQVTPAAVEAQTTGTVEGQVADAAEQGLVSGGGSASSTSATANTVINDVNPTQSGIATAVTTTISGGTITPSTPTRDPAAESTGNDRPAGSARVIIVVPIPGFTAGIR